MKKEWMFAFFTMFLILSCINVASAHRMHVVHKISEIEIEAYFGGGTSVKDADVKVYNEDGNLYVEGTTDEEGKFRFPPKIGMEEYEVVVDATHMPGHKGETTINLSQEGAGGTVPEMPLYTRVIAGFGYLIGIAGAAMAYMGWEQKKKYGKAEKD